MAIETVNPATGKKIKKFKAMTKSEVDVIMDQSNKIFKKWKEISFADRAQLFHALAKDLKQHKDDYAKVITLEMGKPITQAHSEDEKCALVCEYYADNAERHLTEDYVPTDHTHSYVRFDPIGVVLAVMPWNFPFWQVFRAAVPALMA